MTIVDFHPRASEVAEERWEWPQNFPVVRVSLRYGRYWVEDRIRGERWNVQYYLRRGDALNRFKEVIRDHR